MKDVTKLMINEFKIKELGYDFMGYELQKSDILTFHHLIVPKRKHGQTTRENGAIIQRIPHDYLHLIENVDIEAYCYITSEMIDMNIKGYLDIYNLKNIREILQDFENKYDGQRNKKGKILIKEEYKNNRIEW